MLKRVYWHKVTGNELMAKVGFRANHDAPYELYIEKWEKGTNGWIYKGNQTSARQEQLKNHSSLRMFFSLDNMETK